MSRRTMIDAKRLERRGRQEARERSAADMTIADVDRRLERIDELVDRIGRPGDLPPHEWKELSVMFHHLHEWANANRNRVLRAGAFRRTG